MKVRVIRKRGAAVLVEYRDEAGEYHRVTLPRRSVDLKSSTCSAQELERGIPYGVRWSELLNRVAVTPETIEQSLYKIGIWTVEDLHSNSRAAQAAIMAAYGMDLAALLRAVKEASK